MTGSVKNAKTKTAKPKIGRPKKTGRPKKGSPKDLARREREAEEKQKAYTLLYAECNAKYKRYEYIIHNDLLEECFDETIEILTYLVENDYPRCFNTERTKFENYSVEFFYDAHKKTIIPDEELSRELSDTLQELKMVKNNIF